MQIGRYFNTSGPNIPEQHYTIERSALIRQGQQLVDRERYFTIWAPRQTGKSTYFRQLAGYLEADGYKVAHINFENYRTAPVETFLYELTKRLKEAWGMDLTKATDIPMLFSSITEAKDPRYVLIIDEVEGINPEYFGTFLHSIRNVYHSRQSHGLKSVILVGVANILGVVQDNASPFNIADNLDVPYFTDEEVFELLGQHEAETGQRFDAAVKEKICHITANQPGLVNGFAFQLVERRPGKPLLDMDDYLEVEDWYMTEAIDKNISNIINKAKQYRNLVERCSITDAKVLFRINDEATQIS
jgi:predicted AAA+ superfamily ATPase